MSKSKRVVKKTIIDELYDDISRLENDIAVIKSKLKGLIDDKKKKNIKDIAFFGNEKIDISLSEIGTYFSKGIKGDAEIFHNIHFLNEKSRNIKVLKRKGVYIFKTYVNHEWKNSNFEDILRPHIALLVDIYHKYLMSKIVTNRVVNQEEKDRYTNIVERDEIYLDKLGKEIIGLICPA